jgi:thiamine biosynthesis lipoprotein
MGTLFRITLYAAEEAEASKAAMAAFERVEELEEILSSHREDSELTRLPRLAVSAPQAVSRDLFRVLAQAQQISQLSGGAFDVTVGPLVELWREVRRTKRLPEAAELARARTAVGYRNIELDLQAGTVLLKRNDMKLDLGGIAKGYAADQALALLKSRGIHRALIDAGGDLAVGAAPPGKAGWKVTVRDLDSQRRKPSCTLVLHDVGIATSGDAYQSVDVGGRHYSHIIDPRDGMGLQDGASTTVIARDGTTADALATALSVMPVSDALRLVESIDGASAYIVRGAEDGVQGFFSREFPQACNDSGKRGP